MRTATWSEEYLMGITTAVAGKIDYDDIRSFAFDLQDKYFNMNLEDKPFEITDIIFSNDNFPFFQGLLEGLSGRRLKRATEAFNEENLATIHEQLKEDMKYISMPPDEDWNFRLVQIVDNGIFIIPYIVSKYQLEYMFYEINDIDFLLDY